jgi:hypothetical protein
MSQPRHTHKKVSCSSTKPPNLTTLYKIITIMFQAITLILIQALVKLECEPNFSSYKHVHLSTIGC